MTCPISRDRLNKVILKYGKYSDFFINHDGLRAADLKDNPLKRLKKWTIFRLDEKTKRIHFFFLFYFNLPLSELHIFQKSFQITDGISFI